MCQTKSTQKTNQDTIAVSACGDAWGEGGQTRTGARPTRFTARPLFCARAGQRVAYTHTYATTCCCIIDCSVRISNRRSYQNKGFLAIYFLHNGKFVSTALMVWKVCWVFILPAQPTLGWAYPELLVPLKSSNFTSQDPRVRHDYGQWKYLMDRFFY